MVTRDWKSLVAIVLLVASPATLLAQKPVETPPDVCWTSEAGGNGHWYRVVVLEAPVSWAAARHRSIESGGHLVQFNTGEENAFVSKLAEGVKGAWSGPASKPVGPWIGAFREEDDGEPAKGWVWAGGSPVSSPTWAKGSPAPRERNAHYVALGRGGEWVSLAGKASPVKSFIIEFMKKPVPAGELDATLFDKEPRFAMTSTDVGAGKRWYKVVRTDDAISWAAAKEAAASAGGQLACVSSIAESRVVADVVAGVLWKWADEPATDRLAWIGASRSKVAPGGWAWLDGSSWDGGVAKWARGQPGRNPAANSAVAVHPRGVWFVDPQQSKRTHAYVIEFDRDPNGTVQAPKAKSAPEATGPADDKTPLGLLQAYFARLKAKESGKAREQSWDVDSMLARVFGDAMPGEGADLNAIRDRFAVTYFRSPEMELLSEVESQLTLADARSEVQADGTVKMTYMEVDERGHKEPMVVLVKNIHDRWRIIDVIDQGEVWWLSTLRDRYLKSGKTPREFAERMWGPRPDR